MTRDWLRAAFVAFHLVAVTIMAFPAPSGSIEGGLPKSGTAKDQLQMWSEVTGRLGVAETPEELEALVVSIGSRWVELRKDLLRPFRPYVRWTGAKQSWRLFSFIERRPGRLRVEIDRGSGFETVFLWNDPDARWMEHVFTHGRVRGGIGYWSGNQHKKSWPRFVAWIARRAERDFPGATAVRVSMLRAKTPDARSLTMGHRADPKVAQEIVVPLHGQAP